MEFFRLTSDGRVKYSKLESRAFAALSADPIDTKELAKRLYGGNAPYHSVGAARSTVQNLIKKIDFNQEPFRVMKSAARGPHPMDWWVERRRK